MKTDAEINYRQIELGERKVRCLTCIYYAETDHRSGEGECENEHAPGDTNRNMVCDLWKKK